jgi:hypothetical protein
MSSKRKSPPTKLDGTTTTTTTATTTTTTNGVTDMSLNHHDPVQNHHHYHPHHLDLSIKSEQVPDIENIDQCNGGDRVKSKRRSDPNQFHLSEQSYALQNLLAKRRKSDNFTNDNVPSLGTSPCHNNNNNNNKNNNHSSNSSNSNNFMQIKREQNGSDGEYDVGGFNNNNNHDHDHDHAKKDLHLVAIQQQQQQKKTMNDVLKLLTNKMKGSSLKDGSRKGSVEGSGGENEGMDGHG